MHSAKLLGCLVIALVAVVGCSDVGPELEVKRMVAICVQEPAVVLQDYYGHARVVASVSDKPPVEQILDLAKRNRKRELDSLHPSQRTLVESRMRELLEWINANTRITTASSSPRGAPGISEVQLPSSDALNQKAKSLCVEIFRSWSDARSIGETTSKYVLIALTALAILGGANVLRNPIKGIWNTLAALSYFAGAATAWVLRTWWPILAGWLCSLAFQGLMTWRIARGKYNKQINEARTARGLHPLQESDESAQPPPAH